MKNNPLVCITEESHGVKISLAYATADNITGRKIYSNTVCALHPDAEQCLRKAVAHAQRAGFSLLIYDAYRPTQAQQRLWDFLPDDHYVTPPTKGSAHTRGVAIDLSLVDKNGVALDMGTGFDDMSSLSHTDCQDLPEHIIQNRLLLLGIMLHAGFKEINYEWWHYQLPNAFEYPLLDSDLISVVS